jgi:hypothetical protein
MAWCGCRGVLEGEGAVEARVDLTRRVIGVMVQQEGTLVERELERGEGEERVLLINTSHPDFTVPGANGTPAAPAASAPAKTATRQKRLSDGTSKPAGTSDDGARRQGTAARGRRRASTASSSDSAGTSTEEGADSADPEDLVDEHGRLLVSQSTASGDYLEDELGPDPYDPYVH